MNDKLPSLPTRALVVDDDSRILSIAERWLSAAGYEVSTSSDFADARAELRISEPDVVVLDVRLGEFNGLHLAILARQARSDTKVVIMSSWDDAVVRREAAHVGATFVAKPFRAAELLEAVRGLGPQ